MEHFLSSSQALVNFLVPFFLEIRPFFFFYIALLICSKKKVVTGVFLGCPVFAAGIHFQWIRNPEGRLLKVNLPQEPGLNLN